MSECCSLLILMQKSRETSVKLKVLMNLINLYPGAVSVEIYTWVVGCLSPGTHLLITRVHAYSGWFNFVLGRTRETAKGFMGVLADV
jgi:hypothetical protein